MPWMDSPYPRKHSRQSMTSKTRTIGIMFVCMMMGCAADAVDEDQRGPLGKADDTGSCVKPDGDFCGGQADGCHCDDLCDQYGDCCGDYWQTCICQPAGCSAGECGVRDDGCGGEVDCGECGCPAGEIGAAESVLSGGYRLRIMDAAARAGHLGVLMAEGTGSTVEASFGTGQLNALDAGLIVATDLYGYTLDVATGGAITARDDGFALAYNLRDYTYGDSTCVADSFDFAGSRITQSINLRSGKGCRNTQLTWAGDRYWALWSNSGSGLLAVGLPSLAPGATHGPSRLVAESHSNGRALAWDGDQLYAAYSAYVGRDDNNQINTEIFVKVVDGGAAVQVSSRPGVSRWPELAAGPDGVALVWDDQAGSKLFTMIDANGQPLFRPVVLAASASAGSSIRRGAAGYGVLWRRGAGGQLWFAEVDGDGNEIVPAQVVATGAKSAHLVFDDGAYFAVWTNGTSVFATRICGS